MDEAECCEFEVQNFCCFLCEYFHDHDQHYSNSTDSLQKFGLNKSDLDKIEIKFKSDQTNDHKNYSEQSEKMDRIFFWTVSQFLQNRLATNKHKTIEKFSLQACNFPPQ